MTLQAAINQSSHDGRKKPGPHQNQPQRFRCYTV